MSSVKDELNKLGAKIASDARKNAAPNKKSGQLDKSIKYETSIISNDKFQIIVSEKEYGKYLNNKTGYMDKAIKDNLDKGIDSIMNVITGNILNPIKELNK